MTAFDEKQSLVVVSVIFKKIPDFSMTSGTLDNTKNAAIFLYVNASIALDACASIFHECEIVEIIAKACEDI